jgi:hypothetical protein
LVEHVEVKVQPYAIGSIAELPLSPRPDGKRTAGSDASSVHEGDCRVDEVQFAGIFKIIAVPVAEHENTLGRDGRARVGDKGQLGWTVSSQSSQFHVGCLSGWRVRGVEGVRVAVDEPQSRPQQVPLQRCSDAEQQRAVSAEHKRPP